MCGITGIISNNPEVLNEIETINEVQFHRGPDGGGLKVLDNIALGHRRLSIIDLSDAGAQPMCYQDRYWITYNGEIYNYLELREELEKQGYSFKTSTDTEVVMAAYSCWGSDCLNKFNGMWAFCIYDQKSGKALISRDRFGIKPLYYYQGQGTLVFASEIKALLACSVVQTEPNVEYIRTYIEKGPSEWKKHTAFKNVHSFPHAHYFEGSWKQFLSDISPEPYWSLRPNTSNELFDEGKAKTYIQEYRRLLADAVKLRLRSDVKVGSALSGGLDSSSIVSLVNQHLKEKGAADDRQVTFSSVYPSEATKNEDESEYIAKIAEYLHVKSETIEPVADDIVEEHRKMIYLMDNPPESTCMSGWHTFKLVATTDVTVTLDGQGADEQLGGYFGYIYQYLRTCKKPGREAQHFRELPGINQDNINDAISFNKKYGRLKPVLKGVEKYKKYFTPINEVLAKDVMSKLVQLIHYSDRVSMAFSKESRMPFMDYRLVEFTASIPASYKLHKGWTKWVAREAMVEDLPQEITYRKDKMGWPIPEKYWFQGPLKDWFLSTIQNSTFIKQLGYNNNIKDRLEKGNDMKGLVRLLNAAVWHEVFFGKN